MWGLKKHYYILQSGSEGGSLTWFWKKQQLQDKNFIIKLHVSLPTLLRCLICWFSFMRTYQNHATVLNEKYWVNTFRLKQYRKKSAFRLIPVGQEVFTRYRWNLLLILQLVNLKSLLLLWYHTCIIEFVLFHFEFCFLKEYRFHGFVFFTILVHFLSSSHFNGPFHHS